MSYNHLFQIASVGLMPYIEAQVGPEFIKELSMYDDSTYTEALALASDMCIVELFKVLQSIKYFG